MLTQTDLLLVLLLSPVREFIIGSHQTHISPGHSIRHTVPQGPVVLHTPATGPQHLRQHHTNTVLASSILWPSPNIPGEQFRCYIISVYLPDVNKSSLNSWSLTPTPFIYNNRRMAVATLNLSNPINPINGDQRLAVPTFVWDEDPHHVSEEKKMKEKLSYALKIISGPLHNCSGNLSNYDRRCKFNFS